VVFGGIHASLYVDEVFERGGAHAVVKGDGDLVWPRVLADCANGRPQRVYDGGRVAAEDFVPARWDLLPNGKYMWASVQTVRGCPKHCSFCSVWRTDGQRPRQRTVDAVIKEVVELRRRGFRFVTLADDNFYPVTLDDLRQAEARGDRTRLAGLTALRDERFALMEQLSRLPDDMIYFTQITMEAADDEAFLAAMKKARIKGTVVGIESVTPEGLKAVFKTFNRSGDELVARLQAFRRYGVHVLGSFIFGLPSDTPETFDATVALAHKAEVTIAQFGILQPFPGTVDFERWEKVMKDDTRRIDGVPLTRYWLIPQTKRPRLYTHHPTLSPADVRALTQRAWDRFYELPRIWHRARRIPWRGRLVFTLMSKLYRQMYANTGIATDSARVARSERWARWLAALSVRLFQARPMPDLALPQPLPPPAVTYPAQLVQLTRPSPR
jgi:radical SAM superfamily enzyme YgiQ (UPF0313 family)